MERTRTFVVGTAMVVVVALVAFFTWQYQRQGTPTVAAPAAEDARQDLDRPGEGETPPQDELLPPIPPESPRWDVSGVTLGESDASLRGIVRDLSGHQLVASLLAADELAATFVTAVDNIAEGATPAPMLTGLAPEGRFSPDRAGDTFVFSDENAGRYDRLTGLALSLSPRDCAELYRTFYPMLAQAYQELGYPEADFHRALDRALRHLMETPEPEGPVMLVRRVTTYAYADPALESLSPAQKQLLRTGPENLRRIKQWLSELRALLAAAPADEPLIDETTQPGLNS